MYSEKRKSRSALFSRGGRHPPAAGPPGPITQAQKIRRQSPQHSTHWIPQVSWTRAAVITAPDLMIVRASAVLVVVTLVVLALADPGTADLLTREVVQISALMINYSFKL